MKLRDVMRDLKNKIPQAEDELQPGSLESALRDAVFFYSRLKPRTLLELYNGDGETYDFRLPKEWANSFSKVLSVEYPAGNRTPSYIDHEEFIVYYKTNDNPYLRLLSSTPKMGEQVLVELTGLHSLNKDDSTIPEAHIDPVISLAASYVADNLAAIAAGHTDSTLNSSMVNYRSKRTEYERVANQYRKRFTNFFGIKNGESFLPAAAAFGAIDTVTSERYGVRPL
jgi:hypothetical protein